MANPPCISLPVLPFNYKHRFTARYLTLHKKHAFAPLAMFDIHYLIEECLDKRTILYPPIKHVLNKA